MRRRNLAKHAVFQIVVKWPLEDTCAVNNSRLWRCYFYSIDMNTFFSTRNVSLETCDDETAALSNQVSNENKIRMKKNEQKHVKIYLKTVFLNNVYSLQTLHIDICCNVVCRLGIAYWQPYTKSKCMWNCCCFYIWFRQQNAMCFFFSIRTSQFCWKWPKCRHRTRF